MLPDKRGLRRILVTYECCALLSGLLGSQGFILILQTSTRNIAATLGTCRSSCGDELCVPGTLVTGILLKMDKDFWKTLLSIVLGAYSVLYKKDAL